jgi:hypothetical protein
MWLLPVVKPPPGATAGTADWVALAVVVGLLAAITAALIVAMNRDQSRGASRPARPEHHDRAA